MSLPGKGGDVSVSQNVDPKTQAYVDQLRRAALGYAGIGGPSTSPTAAAPRRGGFGGMFDAIRSHIDRGASSDAGYSGNPNLPQATIDPALLEALQGYQGYADIGKMGLTALSGGENPWMAASNPIYRDIRAQTLQSVGDNAALSGAFGGDRQGIAEAESLRGIGKDQAADAYSHAAQAAGFGLAGLGGQAELARYIQEYPQLFASRQLGILNAGIGPYGQTSTQHMSSDPFSQLLGLGVTGLSLFGGGGPLAGLFGSQIPDAVDTSSFDPSVLPYIQPWRG